MTRALWNGTVAWLWYAFGCPPRFPLPRVAAGSSWDVCDYATGRVYLVVPSRTAARALVAVARLARRIRTGSAAGSSMDYARTGEGWIR